MHPAIRRSRLPQLDALMSTRLPDSDITPVDRVFEAENCFPHRPKTHPSINPIDRQVPIDWIIRVHSDLGFKPITAYLAISYFDWFLLSGRYNVGEGWCLQLLAVTCLSLAAKSEEAYIPPVMDFQISDPIFAFEAEPIQKMELFVLRTFNWRLWSITPFDYIYYFVSKLKFKDPKLMQRLLLLSTSSKLILKTTHEPELWTFPPSIIAATVLLAVADEGIEFPNAYFWRADKEMVKNCYEIVERFFPYMCHPSAAGKLAADGVPPSTMGAPDMGASSSCTTSADAQSPAKRSRHSE